CRLDVTHECVQILDHRLHDLSQPRIRHRAPSIEHDVGDVAFRHVSHELLQRIAFQLLGAESVSDPEAVPSQTRGSTSTPALALRDGRKSAGAPASWARA